jgi:hypothetical protein
VGGVRLEGVYVPVLGSQLVFQRSTPDALGGEVEG